MGASGVLLLGASTAQGASSFGPALFMMVAMVMMLAHLFISEKPQIVEKESDAMKAYKLQKEQDDKWYESIYGPKN